MIQSLQMNPGVALHMLKLSQRGVQREVIRLRIWFDIKYCLQVYKASMHFTGCMSFMTAGAPGGRQVTQRAICTMGTRQHVLSADGWTTCTRAQMRAAGCGAWHC